MEKDTLGQSNQKTAVIVILMSSKADFKSKNIVTDKEGHFLLIINSKHLCIQPQSMKIHEAKTKKTAKRNFKMHHFVGEISLALFQKLKEETESQQGYRRYRKHQALT